ncbi:MAG: HAMP domain-containing protein, partial [Chloroflexota bacterium]|nr:HAMP domain-containing protein [Chloroflexota bacterium]
MKLRFPFKSLRTGLQLTYLILIVVSLGLLAWRIGSSLDASRYAETQRDQEVRVILGAHAVGDWLANYRDGKIDLAMLQADTATLSREIDQPITILDPQGKVLVDSQNPEEPGTDESNLPDVQIGMAGHSGSVARYDPDDKTDALFSVAPVHLGRDVVGILRLELSMNLIRDASLQLWIRIAGAAFLAALLTAAVSLWFAKTLADPIAAITRASATLARGDLKQRVRAAGPEEVQQLAHIFNWMAERVASVMEDQSAFVANAAHELRAPLTTIRLRVDALSEGAMEDPAVASQFLTDIANETERLSRLVKELLDLSRIETGLITPRREPVFVDHLARAVVA